MPKVKEISGLEGVDTTESKVFHAGTTLNAGKVVTNGGRVLCATALGNSVTDAQQAAYAQAKQISWEDVYMRTDIAYRAIAREGHK